MAKHDKIPKWKIIKITTYFRNNPNKTMLEIANKFGYSKSNTAKIISNYLNKKSVKLN